MTVLLAFPVITVLLMIQTVVVSHLTLLHGSADIIMLVVLAWLLKGRDQYGWIWALFSGVLIGFVSALSMFVPLISYVALYGLTQMFQKRVWQMPIVVMLALSVIGTMIYHLLTYMSLRISGVPVSFGESMGLIILPSMLLNLMLSIPIYILVTDLVGFLYPEEVEI